MGLIKCKDCGTQISKSAASCPVCGRPGRGANTIEQTAKRYKAWQFVSVLGIFVGPVLALRGTFQHHVGIGWTTFWVSCFLLMVTQANIWWEHK